MNLLARRGSRAGPKHRGQPAAIRPSPSPHLMRSVTYVVVRHWYAGGVSNVNSDEVRIPRHAREAVARHETVVVFNRERPVVALVHPDDAPASAPSQRGRNLRSLIKALRALPSPDEAFADDMTDVIRSEDITPENSWAP